jgi:hypothetical protein
VSDNPETENVRLYPKVKTLADTALVDGPATLEGDSCFCQFVRDRGDRCAHSRRSCAVAAQLRPRPFTMTSNRSTTSTSKIASRTSPRNTQRRPSAWRSWSVSPLPLPRACSQRCPLAQTQVLNRAEVFVSLLYTYRSCSKAMPMVLRLLITPCSVVFTACLSLPRARVGWPRDGREAALRHP